MNDKFNITRLFSDESVFILGAGASKDYGFPLWGDLKNKIIEKLKQDLGSTEPEHADVGFWINKLEEKRSSELTIDAIVAENISQGEIILKKMSEILAEHEQQDVMEDGWIELFFEKLAEFLATKKLDTTTQNGANEVIDLIKKLSIVTLNYDRSFEEHASKKIKDILQQKLSINDNIWNSYYDGNLSLYTRHLHGAIGDYISPPPQGNVHCSILCDIKKTYGTVRVTPYGSADKKIGIGVVGEFGDNLPIDAAYHSLKSIMKNNRKIFLIGVSDVGIINCHIDFPESAEYYFIDKYNDKQKDVIRKKIRSGSLNFLDCYAQEFVKNLSIK